MQDFRIVQSEYWFCATHQIHVALGLSAALYPLQVVAAIDVRDVPWPPASTSQCSLAHYQQQIMRCLTLCSTFVGHASRDDCYIPGLRPSGGAHPIGVWAHRQKSTRWPASRARLGRISNSQPTSQRRSATVVWAACHVRFETSKEDATAVAGSLLHCFHCQTCLRYHPLGQLFRATDVTSKSRVRLPNPCVMPMPAYSRPGGDPFTIAMRDDRIREARQAVSFFCRHNGSWPAPSSH